MKHATILNLHESQLAEVFSWLSEHCAHDNARCDNYRWSFKPSKPFDIAVQDYMFFFREESDCRLFEMRWK